MLPRSRPKRRCDGLGRASKAGAHGDFASNAALALGKRVKRNPRARRALSMAVSEALRGVSSERRSRERVHQPLLTPQASRASWRPCSSKRKSSAAAPRSRRARHGRIRLANPTGPLHVVMAGSRAGRLHASCRMQVPASRASSTTTTQASRSRTWRCRYALGPARSSASSNLFPRRLPCRLYTEIAQAWIGKEARICRTDAIRKFASPGASRAGSGSGRLRRAIDRFYLESSLYRTVVSSTPSKRSTPPAHLRARGAMWLRTTGFATTRTADAQIGRRLHLLRARRWYH